jgi:hypothetical protein
VNAAATESVAAFAERLSNAYSTERYVGGWSGCIAMMRERGYTDLQVEAVIRSKWTRWAADAAGTDAATPADLAKFLDVQPLAEVEALTQEAFGSEQ